MYLTALACNAQINFVPNPDFEQHTQCPQNGEMSYLISWYDPTLVTSDYYNLCASSCSNPMIGCYGIQQPRSGSGFIGLIAYINNGSIAREYVQIQLTEPLLAGVEYCISFYASLGDTCDYAVNNLGCLLSNQAIVAPTPPYANLIQIPPQIVNDGLINPLTSTSGWTKVEGSFVAQGGEQYLTIGNFFDDNQTDTVFTGGANGGGIGMMASYYYVDDVSVNICNYAPPAVILPNIFTPNNDGINDVYFIQSEAVSRYRLDIYNRWGIEIRTLSDQDTLWDGTYNGQFLTDGVYFCRLTYYDLVGKAFTLTGTIQLVR